MRKIMVKLHEYLEKKLYGDPSYGEISKYLDQTRYKLFEAKREIEYLKSLINNHTDRR